jgi:hypothetical protein
MKVASHGQPAHLHPQKAAGREVHLHASPVLQVVDLLTKLYKFPNFSISRALLYGTTGASATVPTVASAATSAPSHSQGAAVQAHDVPIGEWSASECPAFMKSTRPLTRYPM